MVQVSVGDAFGRWTVIKSLEPRRYADGQKKKQWLCRCVCGNEKQVGQQFLLKGQSTSCGCLAREILSKRSKTHGLTRSPAYRSWESMKRRVDVPTDDEYPRYGGRGIKMCQRWRNFENFFADMGQPPKGMTLDRIDNNADYEPGNCRWADRKQQSRNRSNCLSVSYMGKTMPLSVAIEMSGTVVSYNRVYDRHVKLGWPLEKALAA